MLRILGVDGYVVVLAIIPVSCLVVRISLSVGVDHAVHSFLNLVFLNLDVIHHVFYTEESSHTVFAVQTCSPSHPSCTTSVKGVGRNAVGGVKFSSTYLYCTTHILSVLDVVGIVGHCNLCFLLSVGEGNACRHVEHIALTGLKSERYGDATLVAHAVKSDLK